MKNQQLFVAKYNYNLLECKQTGNTVDRIGTTLFNSKIRLTPHQIEAALFAFKSPLDKGTILADEVGLGKTIEAGIVLAQLWNEHKRKIIIITPASLMRQWGNELLEKFNLPSIILDRKTYNSLRKKGIPNPFNLRNKIIICSYQMCSVSEEDIVGTKFDLAVIDEAHKLRNVWTGKNIISGGIKRALANTKKLLLTATPIQNNVLDLYGITTLIDDDIFGDKDVFRERYVKNYDLNLNELKGRLNKYVHRTLREQVQPYIRFTKRIPKTFDFTQTPEELKVYEDIRALLLNSDEETYLIPAQQKHLLLLILCKLMGSSIHSIVYTLETMKRRLVKLYETGVDEGLEGLFDDDLTDDEDYNYEENNDKNIVINKAKLKDEISNLDRIIKEASQIKIESKYLALKESIDFGFKHLNKLGANEKILIFTESRRTQDYIYRSLLEDGYDEVLMFNGSNNDDVSKKIYDNWCSKPENEENLKNSKGVNMRQAIIDYFKDKGKILIATEAGAEGLNMQFCSMVVNYDLPWNPQLVEQRIGRCHRFGQEHDVVVINFISSSNVVEQRIYELLSSKFKVFNEIFGSSDSILGSLEDGVDLQNAIVSIYTKCRTIKEINDAFDKLQEKYKDVIDESMKKTKRDLLDNFDEDLQEYFSDVLDSANKSVNKVQSIFWRLTKSLLIDADYDDNHKTFSLGSAKYCLTTDPKEGYIRYNMNSVLGQRILEDASKINAMYGHIKFDITNYPYKLTNIEELKGKHGYLILNKLTIDSFDSEEHLFFNGYLENGKVLDEDTISKMFRLETEEDVFDDLDDKSKEILLKDSEIHSKKIVLESEERNNQILNEEITKINKWAEDKIEATQFAVELLRNERKNLQKQSDLAESSFEKEKIEEEILKLSKKIRNSWIELADAEEEIELKRKSMISKLRKQLMKSNVLTPIFMVSFEIV